MREDVARVEMELARAKVELKRAESLREQSLAALALAIGDSALSVRSLAGSLDVTFEIPTLESSPRTCLRTRKWRWPTPMFAPATPALTWRKPSGFPDVKVDLLYRRLQASKENAFDVGLSIPLPLFNRNQGRLREARAEVAAAEARSRLTQNELTTRLCESYLQLAAALANSRTLKTEILARAETVLKKRRSALRRRRHQSDRNPARAPRLGGGATELPGIVARRDAGVGGSEVVRQRTLSEPKKSNSTADERR